MIKFTALNHQRMLCVQEIGSVYTSVLWRRLRANLAWQPALYRQRAVFRWMWTQRLGRS